MRTIARAIRELWYRARFLAWVERLRFELARQGGRLRVEAPHGVRFDRSPQVKVFPDGTGSGTTTLRFGRDVRFGRDTTLELWSRGDNLLEIGDTGRLMNSVRLILRSGRISIGRRCDLRDGVWLKSDGDLVIGDDVPIAQHSSVHCAKRIEFEDLVGLAERVSVLDSDHTVDGSDTHFRDQPVRISPVRLQRNTFIAAGAVILRGVEVGANSVVAANTVVREGPYPPGSVLAGNPARLVKTLGVEEAASWETAEREAGA